MPIETLDMKVVSEKMFHEIDFSVMKHAFEVHNGLGRFFDEDIYRDDLARLCREVGFEVETEVPVKISHKDFSKTYFIDLLINGSVIYELKTVKGFDGSHRRQLLNYLFICGQHHGKLINFRSSRVEHEFVSTSLDLQQRHIYSLKEDRWQETDCESALLKTVVTDLLEDWGVFLEAAVYSEAIVHFFGGADRVETYVDVYRGGTVVGHQKFRMLNETTAFYTTAIKHRGDYEKYLKSVIKNTGIECVQWINFDKHAVEFVTVV
jgi:GxxExxY protein